MPNPTYKRMEKLIATDTVSRQLFDDSRDKRDAAAQRAESARQHLALLQAGTRPEDLNAAEAKYQQAEAAAVLSRKGFRKEDIDAARGRLDEARDASPNSTHAFVKPNSLRRPTRSLR